MASRALPAPLRGKCGSGGSRQLERKVCVGGGEGARGRQRAGEKGLPGAQWSPRGGPSEDNASLGTRGRLRQADGRAPAASSEQGRANAPT